MLFNEFANKLFSVLGNGASTHVFTRTLFDAITTNSGKDILDGYTDSSYKGFYNGHTSISRISKKINTYVEPMEFSAYIMDEFSDAVRENLCAVFHEDIPGIEPSSAGDELAALFVEIITQAAGANKKSTHKGASKSKGIPPILLDVNGVAPDLGTYEDGVLYLDKRITDEDEANPFQKYLDAASSYYSTKKTLLYAEKPHPFYELYVCNNVRYRKFRATGARDFKPEKNISNATIEKLEAESKYIIIEGTGGIGKSMLLTHLFLSSAEKSADTGSTPFFLSLKNYKDTTSGIVDFIWKSAREFDAVISQNDIITALQEKNLVLLMDGLDEIQSTIRENFDTDLEAFIKSYPGNTIVITSRPVFSFITYSKFSVFDIQELTKEQALELVQKLEFWDTAAKENFMKDLDRHLYTSHYQFASNPLLLTIMLMTYTTFGEVPAKMHVFYSKAYETMARLHDASKGTFKRKLHSKLTPEEFAKYFAEFCARTYTEEVLEFTERTFSAYMAKVLKDSYAEFTGVQPRDFLLDLTDNLCIMYREGEKYYFIHRSFQEYFAAVHFASSYDNKLKKVGDFFERMQHRSYTDRTFAMLYDMIPAKVERFIFLPFLESLMADCSKAGDDEEYWEFLERMYPALYYEEGETGDSYPNEPQSFLYQSIVREKLLEAASDLDDYGWPKQIYDLPTKTWVSAYREFTDDEGFYNYPDPVLIREELLEDTTVFAEEDLPSQYFDYFGSPDEVGITVEIEIYELRKNPAKYAWLRDFMEQAEFPILREYCNVKKYYEELKARIEKENDSNSLFDD
ncbi:NACHT domain-containing protein [Lachnospiraceae bacterium 48-42]|jgi:hypothetical protein|nr:NACHT domain-containing protein [Eubacterium sp.]NBI63521.1 NACHT domain-containing protein [Clostridiales bacterium]